MATKADRYEGIDGLKAYAIIGIALMHVLANGEYGIGGFVFERLIPSFTNLVFLFMMVSGFGMCCGYYQKIIDQKISVEDFYKKRYIKIWPYFALLCALDFVISPSKESLFEVFANLTLCQGLLPNAKISVIGVSWTLAVIFVFYMLFPFFCFLIGNKKRAWCVAVAALAFNWLCGIYFFDGNHIVDFSPRTNIVYDAIYFIIGGLVFLYRKELAEFAAKYKVIAGAILLIATVAYFALGGNVLTMLFFCVAALVYTLGCNRGGVLVNPVAKFLGGICFEIYLCHMVIYRVLEKLHLVHLFGNGLLAYIFTAVAVICGSVVFSVCAKWFLNKIETFLKERVPFIEIGKNCRITAEVIILAHDYSYAVLRPEYHCMPRKAGVTKVGDNVFVGMKSIILMGSQIGNNVIIGAGAVVSGNIPDNVVVAGNPAKVVCTLDDYYERQIKRLDSYAKIYYKRTKSYLQRELTENDMNWYNQLWKFEGKDQIYAGIKVDGDNISEIISDLKNVKPIYESFDDFKRSIDT